MGIALFFLIVLFFIGGGFEMLKLGLLAATLIAAFVFVPMFIGKAVFRGQVIRVSFRYNPV